MNKKVISIDTLRAPKRIGNFTNAKMSSNRKNSLMVEDAIGELKQQTGIDFLKVFSGDTRENQKLTLKRYQDAFKL